MNTLKYIGRDHHTRARFFAKTIPAGRTTRTHRRTIAKHIERNDTALYVPRSDRTGEWLLMNAHRRHENMRRWLATHGLTLPEWWTR